MKAILSRRTPLVYLISDRQMLARQKPRPDTTALIDFLCAAIDAGVDLIQLRERDLSPRALLAIADAIVPVARTAGAALLINDRADLAAGAGAGVHLTTRSLEPKIVRQTFGDDFLIGASTHSLAEATNARDGGADFVVLGPIFPTPSKDEYGPPLGVHCLADVAAELTPFPVLALGGISIDNAQQCLRAGASGIAGITVFRTPENFSRMCDEVGKFSQIHSGVTE